METAKEKCPFCNSANVAWIMYGLPYFSEELRDELKNSRVVLGGCCVTNDDPVYHCNDCGKDWCASENRHDKEVKHSE